MKTTLLLAIILFAVIISAKSQGYNGYTYCAEQDSLALVAFYNATDGPNWTCNQDGFGLNNLSDDVLTYHSIDYPYAGMGKWLVGPVKDWFGVLLAKQPTGIGNDSAWRVIHLRPTISRRSAGDNNLKGYVPRELGLLTALEWFKVNGNAGLKNSELPDEIYHPSLLQLDFESVYLKGILSNALRNCTKLDLLNFRYNYFDTIPTLDFLSQDHLLAMSQSVFIYNNQISFATWEKSVDYFLTFSNPLQIKYEARQLNNVGRETEIVVSPGSNVVLQCNEAGVQGEYKNWYRNGFNTYKSGQTLTLNSVAASDTGFYQVSLINDYIRLGDQNADYGAEPYCKSKKYHVTFIPTIPVCKSAETNYEGDQITLTFSKPMAMPTPDQFAQFSILKNSQTISVVNMERTGRLSDKYVLYLSAPIAANDTVILMYTKGSVSDVNTGALQSIANLAVNNMARPLLNCVSAITRTDGTSIFVTFDGFINGGSIVPGDFEIQSTNADSVISAVLKTGELNSNISKTVELILQYPLQGTDIVSISYNKGSLSGLYSGRVSSFGPISVQNTVVEVKYLLKLYFKDGLKKFKSPLIKGSITSSELQMYNDGTNGDDVSQDLYWTMQIAIPEGSYNWSIYEHVQLVTYDTIKTVDPETGAITMVLTPHYSYIDTVVSKVLNVNILDGIITGDTLYGIFDKTVTFQLNMDAYSKLNPLEPLEPYLMGISSDWSTGIAMALQDSLKPDNIYKYVIAGFSTGDVVNYTFRNGDVWDYNLPLKKRCTVKDNDTILLHYFGFVPTGVAELPIVEGLNIYPNPASQLINLKVSNNESIKLVRIYNNLSNCILYFEMPDKIIDIQSLAKGIYFLEVITKSNKVYKKSFIKIE